MGRTEVMYRPLQYAPVFVCMQWSFPRVLQALSLSQALLWPRLKPLWDGFCARAISHYGWHETPLSFEVVTRL